MDNREKVIAQFKKCVSDIWLQDGQNTWPIEINSIIHLFIDIFVKELFADIHRLKTIGMDDQEIAARFKTAARIIRLIMPCVQGMKILHMPVEKIREHVLYLLTLVKHLKHGDLFNRDKKNILLSTTGIQHAVDETKLIQADPGQSSLVHKLCAVLWNYAESVCFKTHGLIRQFHGPYRLADNHNEILIRDFIHLDPIELWPQCHTVPYKSIRVITFYRNPGISVDLYDNVAIKQDCTYIDCLASYYVEADLETSQKVLNREEIKSLGDVLLDIIISITTGIETLDWQQLAKKYAEIFWFSKKELKTGQGQDWHPPAVVDERIETGQINTRLQNPGPQALQRMLRISF